VLAQVSETTVPDLRRTASSTAAPSRPRYNIRPLRASETRACETFCAALDRRDIRLRFGSWRRSVDLLLPNPEPPHPRMALAAIDATGAVFGLLNLACLGEGAAEIALIVRSDLKRHGVGRSLVVHAIDWARAHGLDALIGYVDAENAAVLSLAREMGFERVRWDAFSIEVRRRLDLPSIETGATAFSVGRTPSR
jgi:acetyltransferase